MVLQKYKIDIIELIFIFLRHFYKLLMLIN